MDQLKRMSSKRGLRKTKDDSRRHSEPIFEDIVDPSYDCVYDKPGKRPTHRRRKFADNMSNFTPPSSSSSKFPGTAPARWEDWSQLERGPPPRPTNSKDQWGPPVDYYPPPTPEIPEHPGSTPNITIPSSSPYGDIQLPLFGKQYGISTVNLTQNPTIGAPTKVTRMGALNPYEDMIRQSDADMQRAFLKSLQTAGKSEVKVQE
jgi:hypothetical protein